MTALLPFRASHDPAPDSAGIRPLAPGEAGFLAAHLCRLGPQSRRLRFGTPVADTFLGAYAATRLAGSSAVLGLFVAGELRGAAELCLPAPEAPEAEIAFSLEPAFRGRGLGTRLFAAILAEADARGIAVARLHVQRENVAMLRLARRFGAAFAYDGSEAEALIPVPGLDPAAAMLAALSSARRSGRAAA